MAGQRSIRLVAVRIVCLHDACQDLINISAVEFRPIDFGMVVLGLVKQILSWMTMPLVRLCRVLWTGREPRAAAAEWGSPDRPAVSLGVFQRSGRIHQPGSRPERVLSFAAAQERLLSACGDQNSVHPQISLRLGQSDPDWTDVLLNGALVVQVSTSALLSHSGR